MVYRNFGSDLSMLPLFKYFKRRRSSSYDRTGGNDDFLIITSMGLVTLAEIKGAGIINIFG